MSKINDYLNKGSKGAGKTVPESLSLLPEIETEEEIEAPEGEELPKEVKENAVQVKNLDERDTKEASRVYRLQTKDGRKVRFIGDLTKRGVPALYVTPDFLRPPKPKVEVFATGRQKEWADNIITAEDLRKPTPEFVQSKNPLGIRRYVFVNEFLACKTGMLYYLIPLILSLLFLFNNINKENFLTNAVVATVAVIDLILCRNLIKSRKGYVGKVLSLFFIVFVNVLIFVGFSYIPGFYSGLHLWFTAKLLSLIFAVFYFARFYAYFALAYGADLTPDFGNVVRVVAGDPGCGKTSKSVNECKVMALLKWQELQYEAFIWHSKEAEIFKRNDKNELLEYHAIMESYRFYANNPKGIPCLHSNITIEDDKGRKSFEITLDHIRGVERLPNYCVVFFDEIGAVLSNELSKEKSANFDIADMFRLGRHFLNWTVVCCEQDFNNVFISIRRVVGVNELLSQQEWVARPVILYNIYKFCKWWIADGLDRGLKKKPKTAKMMTWLKKTVYSIGFRRYRYQSMGNTQTGNDVAISDADGKVKLLGKEKVRYAPSNLLAKYDDRAYKQLYASYFDKNIKGSVHKTLTIDGLDIEYGGQFVSETPLIAEKRDAVKKRIQKIA